MKKKELQELRIKKHEELKKLLAEKGVELAKVKVDLKAGREKNAKKGKNISHDIAQIATIIREKELMEQESKKAGKNRL